MTGLHNHGKVAAGLIAVMVFLSGCGASKAPDTIEKTSIVVKQDGKVVSHTVGVFDRDYYDLNGLRKMAQEEVAAYNTANQKGEVTPVTVERVEEFPDMPGRIVVTYNYDSADTYTKYQAYIGYQGEVLFYGTVEQAVAAGYDFASKDQLLYGAKGDQSIMSSSLAEGKTAKKHVILAGSRALVYCPYKVEFTSGNVAVTEDGSVDTTGLGTGEVAIIVLSK